MSDALSVQPIVSDVPDWHAGGVSKSDWLTTGQVARALGVDARTVLRWVASGDLSAVRGPGRRRQRRYAVAHVRAVAEAMGRPWPDDLP